jgi:hypothetical protein
VYIGPWSNTAGGQELTGNYEISRPKTKNSGIRDQDIEISKGSLFLGVLPSDAGQDSAEAHSNSEIALVQAWAQTDRRASAPRVTRHRGGRYQINGQIGIKESWHTSHQRPQEQSSKHKIRHKLDSRNRTRPPPRFVTRHSPKGAGQPGRNVPPADVIAPQDKNVGLFG